MGFSIYPDEIRYFGLLLLPFIYRGVTYALGHASYVELASEISPRDHQLTGLASSAFNQQCFNRSDYLNRGFLKTVCIDFDSRRYHEGGHA